MARRSKQRKNTGASRAPVAAASIEAAPPLPPLKPWLVALQATVLIALSIWIYYPSLHGLYLWDDDFLLQNNATVHDPNGLYAIWSDPEHALIDFFPLTVSLEWFIWQVCTGF